MSTKLKVMLQGNRLITFGRIELGILCAVDLSLT